MKTKWFIADEKKQTKKESKQKIGECLTYSKKKLKKETDVTDF